MVKIYTVKIKFDFIPPPRLDEEGVEIEEDIQVIEGDFQVGADSLPEAMEAAFEHLDANMGETEDEMVSLSVVENMGIVMLPIGLAMVLFSLGFTSLAAFSLICGLFHALNHSLFKGLLFMLAGAINSATHTLNLEKMCIDCPIYIFSPHSILYIPIIRGIL